MVDTPSYPSLYFTPLITDLEKDGQKEIVFVNIVPGYYKLHVIKSNGNYTSGYPKYLPLSDNAVTYSSGDINGDGYLEIAVRTFNKIYVFDKNGNELQGFPVTYQDGSNSASKFLSLYDLDNDGKLEIITNKLNEVCAFRFNGTIMPGWPRAIVGESYAHPAIGDIDNDGFAEVIVASYKQIPSGGADSSAMHIFRHNGSNFSNNWPVYYDSNYINWFASPSIFINKNNSELTRILISQGGNRIGQYMTYRNVTYDISANIINKSYITVMSDAGGLVIISNENNTIRSVNGKSGSVWDTLCMRVYDNLNVLPNWPNVGGGALRSTPVIGKVSSSSSDYIVIANSWSAINPNGYGLIYSFYPDGTQLPWSPLRPIGLVRSISLSDINNDGQTELIAISSQTSNETYLHIWTFPGVPFSYEDFPWPQFGHDRYRTNQYGFIPPDEVIGIKPMSSNIPQRFNLYQNYPNPFNPNTSIKFDISQKTFVQLVVYDVLGRELETLVSEELKAGEYQLTWQASKYASGIYFCKLITQDYTQTRKMVLVR
jgi:hypothetical protein